MDHLLRENLVALLCEAIGCPADKAGEVLDAVIESTHEQEAQTLRAHYEDADADYLAHVGLRRNASWHSFRQHYAKDDGFDIDRAANDLATYPPVAARVAELKAEMEAGESDTKPDPQH